MAHILQLPSGLWQAQVSRKKVRDSATFETRAGAETWAKNREYQILGCTEGEKIALTKRDMMELWARSKERAKARGIDYHLTREQFEQMFRDTEGRCSVSRILFNKFRPLHSTKRPWYPSLDRIDSQKPYTAENCRFVCVAVNMAMGEWGEWVLNAIAKAIVANEPVKCNGPEAPPYKYNPVLHPTYRQLVRRRIREKTKTPKKSDKWCLGDERKPDLPLGVQFSSSAFQHPVRDD